MEATVEPSATQPATAKAAATLKALAETTIPEVVRALPTRAPCIEVLLALSPLHAGLVILVELGEVRGGCGGALATQLALRPARQGVLKPPSPRCRLGVACLRARLGPGLVPRAFIPLRPPVGGAPEDITVLPGIDVAPCAPGAASALAASSPDSDALGARGRRYRGRGGCSAGWCKSP